MSWLQPKHNFDLRLGDDERIILVVGKHP